jgi:hypothetical protein
VSLPGCRALLVAFGALLCMADASAQRTIYKNVDAEGKVTYSDRKSGAADTRVKNWMRAEQGRYAYDSAVLRTESDRVYYARLLADRRYPVPVAIYDPRGWQEARSRPAYALTGWAPRRAYWDPNLPPSPAPSLERNYYYSGR